MGGTIDLEQLDRVNLANKLAVIRARKMLEWMRVVYESEAQIHEPSIAHPVETFEDPPATATDQE